LKGCRPTELCFFCAGTAKNYPEYPEITKILNFCHLRPTEIGKVKDDGRFQTYVRIYSEILGRDTHISHLLTLNVLTGSHWSQTTTTFCLINVSGRSTYSSVHCRRQSVSCRSRSSVEQSSIARHCCPPLSIFCSSLKSHLFSLSYPAFRLFSHLYSARAVTRHFGHYNRYYSPMVHIYDQNKPALRYRTQLICIEWSKQESVKLQAKPHEPKKCDNQIQGAAETNNLKTIIPMS